ncbi:hypothetical protein SAMN05216209_5452 [Pseudomonas nitroreducens]|nr:hypothetical protein SAMN05216209_5452 [Pseudomonas nitroreducens]
MKQRARYYTVSQKASMWDRSKAGDSLQQILFIVQMHCRSKLGLGLCSGSQK